MSVSHFQILTDSAVDSVKLTIWNGKQDQVTSHLKGILNELKKTEEILFLIN